MTINIWPTRLDQSAVTNRLMELAELDRDDARSACYTHRFTIARMLQSGQSIEYVATWMARKFGVGLTPAELAIREKVREEVQFSKTRRHRRLAAL
jgi:hypothetical protein